MYDIHVVFLDVHFFNLPHLYFFFFFYFFYLFFLFFFVVNQLCETTRTAKRTKTMPTTTTTTTTTITTGMEKTVRNRKRETGEMTFREFFLTKIRAVRFDENHTHRVENALKLFDDT